MTEQVNHIEAAEPEHGQARKEDKVTVTVDHKPHHVYPGPYPVSTLKEVLHVPASSLLEEVVEGKPVAIEDSATITIIAGQVFISRMREHKVEVTVNEKAHHIYPGRYVVVTLKEFLHVPPDNELEQVIGEEFKLLADTATIEIAGGEVFVSQELGTLRVTVHYIAAKEPYKDSHAERTETVGTLKARVLTAFGLSEGQQGGQTYTYTLYHGKTALDNLSETLGQVAGKERSLKLKLAQQVTQG